jgi:hypothetical protein
VVPYRSRNEMNDPATQKPSNNKPTPEERVEWFKRKPVVSAVCAIAILLLGGLTYGNKLMAQWDELWSRLHPKTYDVGIYLSWQMGLHPQTGLPYIWRVDDTNEKQQPYCPVGYFLTLSITNLMPDAMTISDYEVSAKGASGHWVQLRRIAVGKFQHIYSTWWSGRLSDAVQFDLDPPPLDQQLSPTATLPPHRPLVGTAVFEDPSPEEPGYREYRVTVRDTLDHVFTSGVLRADDMKANFPGGSYHFGYKQIDLSDRTKHPYRAQCE